VSPPIHVLCWEGKPGDPLCGQAVDDQHRFASPRNVNGVTCEKCIIMVAIAKANEINLHAPGARTAIRKLMQEHE
jgi:hypothetical protein